uniref:DUF148 domain-containing protein n=1 Tax=Strongyloides papillosus TaxID=174720 RepID=A0A0N5CD63_STREA
MKNFIHFSIIYNIKRKHYLILCFYCLSVLFHHYSVLAYDPIRIERYDGDEINVPRGIFHHIESESEINTKYKVPDWETLNPLEIATSLFDTVAEVSSKRKQSGGVHLPMPFGLSPLNIQLTKDSNNGVKLSEPPSTTPSSKEMNSEEKEAFLNARIVCLQQDDQACVRALDKLHRVKYGFSKLADNEIRRKGQANVNIENVIQQGIMEWMLPNVEKRLREMRSGNEVKNVKFSRLPSRFP